MKPQTTTVQFCEVSDPGPPKTDLGDVALRENDPVYRLHRGNSPLILSAPHTGWKVPEHMIDRDGSPLGAPAWWFDPKLPQHRHEVCDWGTAELVERINRLIPHISSISSNVSRLVVEKNRKWEYAITPESSEYGPKICIPGNHNISTKQLSERKAIYDAYTAAENDLISDIKHAHNGAANIALHSFAPEWHGHGRDYEIGITYFEDTTLSELIEHALIERMGRRAASQYPYNLKNGQFSDKIAAPSLSQKHDAPFVMIEIRNDLLQDLQRLEETAELLSDIIHNIQQNPEYEQCLSRNPASKSRETALSPAIPAYGVA
ncbi:MAG: N-formylglutamate amidohydrolase [Rhodospirillales bacterium]|nr:N-formylglutamate amidohydrolase [Rhodospirillales bacterium]